MDRRAESQDKSLTVDGRKARVCRISRMKRHGRESAQTSAPNLHPGIHSLHDRLDIGPERGNRVHDRRPDVPQHQCISRAMTRN